ncbi:hypothetical protein FQA47_006794 [Oryzias melastigma]|uniref:Uncharacterized protein n=1 Tax=Oryzias melastigma TaxID=30732 RepID=A0A834CFZ3_ORYME|nr:hypothetical protein FQA47_006794 [Oryzias melastigma]
MRLENKLSVSLGEGREPRCRGRGQFRRWQQELDALELKSEDMVRSAVCTAAGGGFHNPNTRKVLDCFTPEEVTEEF